MAGDFPSAVPQLRGFTDGGFPGHVPSSEEPGFLLGPFICRGTPWLREWQRNTCPGNPLLGDSQCAYLQWVNLGRQSWGFRGPILRALGIPILCLPVIKQTDICCKKAAQFYTLYVAATNLEHFRCLLDVSSLGLCTTINSFMAAQKQHLLSVSSLGEQSCGKPSHLQETL